MPAAAGGGVGGGGEEERGRRCQRRAAGRGREGARKPGIRGTHFCVCRSPSVWYRSASAGYAVFWLSIQASTILSYAVVALPWLFEAELEDL